MNENAKAWVEALRSGEYKQGQHVLHSDAGYCCLGIACDLAAKAGVVPKPVYDAGIYMYGGEQAYLPPEVVEWLGLADDRGGYSADRDRHSLALTNDRGASFEEIADIIESEPKGLFS